MTRAHKTPCDDPSCPQFVCENRNAHLPPLKQTANTPAPVPKVDMGPCQCGQPILRWVHQQPPMECGKVINWDDVEDALALAKPGRMLPLDNDGNLSAHGVRVVIHNVTHLAWAYLAATAKLRDAEALLSSTQPAPSSAAVSRSEIKAAIIGLIQDGQTRQAIERGHSVLAALGQEKPK